ncbi:MAG: TetR/AcrR family transcriptional regulator [Rhodospirillales bacterium]|nr:TetR/AcrR family transcriptional regulator [Acetobacter sp.]
MKNNVGRRARERNEVRLKIIESARELFTGGSEEALTLRSVAQRIEYSATTIYLHFPNKEALVRTLCAADFADFSRRLIQAERMADPLERLRAVARGYVDFGLQYPNQYRAMFITRADPRAFAGDDAPASETGRDATASEDRDAYDFLHSAVFKALAAGVFRPEYRDIALITQTVWNGLHGVVSLHQVRSNHPRISWRPIQTLAETMIECLLNGLVLPGLAKNPAWRGS